MQNISFAVNDPGIVDGVLIHDQITADVAVGDAKAIGCVGAKNISITITEGGTVLNRSGDFTFFVSVDGTNFYAYSMMIDNVTNSNVQTITRVASKTRAAAGTDVLFFTPETLGGITHFKVVVDVTDGGTPTGWFTVKAAIKF